MQRHAVSPDVAAKPKPEKAGKAAAAKQKDEDQPVIQDADERLLADVHGQATAAVDKIVCTHTCALCLVSSVTFPFIRSSRIAFYFPFPFGQGNSNGATERQCGHDYGNGLRKRIPIWIRMNGNVMLETRHYFAHTAVKGGAKKVPHSRAYAPRLIFFRNIIAFVLNI